MQGGGTPHEGDLWQDLLWDNGWVLAGSENGCIGSCRQRWKRAGCVNIGLLLCGLRTARHRPADSLSLSVSVFCGIVKTDGCFVLRSGS